LLHGIDVYRFSQLFLCQVNVDEKIRFLTDHHHDLLNQRAALDVRLKEAKNMGRETAAQHIAAEVSFMDYCIFVVNY